MLIRIHLVARLFRVPILHLDGDIVLLDDDQLRHPTHGMPPGARPDLPTGRLLALAEAELAVLDDRRRRRAAS